MKEPTVTIRMVIPAKYFANVFHHMHEVRNEIFVSRNDTIRLAFYEYMESIKSMPYYFENPEAVEKILDLTSRRVGDIRGANAIGDYKEYRDKLLQDKLKSGGKKGGKVSPKELKQSLKKGVVNE